MMRKLAFLLALVLMLVPLMSSALADDVEPIEIPATLLNAFDLSASEWYESNTSRAMLCVVVILDVFSYDDEELEKIVSSALVDDEVYVGKYSFSNNLFFFGDEKVLVVTYNPLLDNLRAFVVDNAFSNPELVIEGAMSSDLLSSYYHVDAEDILEATEAFASLIQ